MTLDLWPNTEFLHTIRFEFSNGETFRLPVNPSELPVAGTGSWQDRDIVGLGETSTPLYPKDDIITIESFFPKHYDPTYCAIREGDLKDPREYVKILNEAKSRGYIVHVIITTSEIDKFFTIRKFDWRLVGGELEDIYYTLELKEYIVGSIRAFTGVIIPYAPGAVTELPGVPSTSNPNGIQSPADLGYTEPEYDERPPNVAEEVRELAIEQCMTLEGVAELYGYRIEDLIRLNPHLKFTVEGDLPAGSLTYLPHCPNVPIKLPQSDVNIPLKAQLITAPVPKNTNTSPIS